MGAPISDFANTPFATVVARVARVVGDGSDSDRAPDFLPASGEIVFTPNIKFSKLEVDNKSVIVLNEPVRCTIDPVTGYMIGPDGGFGVRLVASSGVNIEPQGLGYTVTFRGAETRIPDFSIFLEAGSVVDLAKILPVDLQPGIVTTVSSKTVDAVEQALIRLNSLQENVSYTVKSIPDMFRWDGTTLLINGNPGPDLGRITDEKLEEVNNTIDSLAQAHSDLMNGYIETQNSFVELDNKLGQAFPDSIFDVNLAIEQAKDLAEQKFSDSITGTVVEYARNTSETSAPTSGWSTATPTRTPGSYVWMRTTVSYGSGDTSTTNPVLLTGNDGSKGDKGDEGDQGVSVESITPHFLRVSSSATPAKPVGSSPSAWSATEPGYVRDTTMWRSDRIVFSNGQIAWTDVSKSSSYEAAKAAEAKALAYADQKKQEAIALMGSGQNLVVNGNMDSRELWHPALEYSTSGGPDNKPYVTRTGGNLDTYQGPNIDLQPGDVIETSLWLRADKAGSRLYLELRDSSGTHALEGSRLIEKGGQTSNVPMGFYILSNVTVEPEWTKYVVRSTVKAGTAGLYRLGTWYFNHYNGPVTDAVVDVADVQMRVISPEALEAQTTADAAMTMANGKNAVSYTGVPVSVAEPGPAPTAAMGAGRPKYDIHRNRRTNGRIIGEWVWTGTAWTQLTLSDAMLSSLDVGKLTAGTANFDTGVVNKLWGQLGVFDKLDVRTDAYISGTNLKNGAVTARTLNVVPETGQGGLQLDANGMMLIDSEGSGTVDLRVNAENYLSFYHDNATSFSVSADGALSAQNVSANDGLFYRGIELTEFLESMPRGIVYFAEQIDGIHTISQAAYTSRIGHIVVERPSTPRYWRIVARAGVASSSSGGTDTSGAHWQFVSNTGVHYDQDSWKVLASVLYQTSGYYWQTETLEQVVNTDDISWNTSGTALVSWTARNASGSSYKLGQGAIFYIEDMGPAFDRSPTYPWIRPEASADTGSSTTPTSRTGTWSMSSFQNYLSGTRVNHASGNLAGGNYGGEWRGIMFFPHAAIKSALSGATTTKVELYLQNAHTYAYSGSTILIGSHNYASAPSSSPSVAARASQHFSRGQGRWVTLPNAVGDGFKGGTIKGLAVYGGSTANYATWTPSAPKLRITYKK